MQHSYEQLIFRITDKRKIFVYLLFVVQKTTYLLVSVVAVFMCSWFPLNFLNVLMDLGILEALFRYISTTQLSQPFTPNKYKYLRELCG